jgi:hypothetical protein
MPSPKGLHTGMPIGQPNSTGLISSPMRLRSADEGKLFNQSRTGSPPASVRKKIAGTRFSCFSSASDRGPLPVGDLEILGLSTTRQCTMCGTLGRVPHKYQNPQMQKLAPGDWVRSKNQLRRMAARALVGVRGYCGLVAVWRRGGVGAGRPIVGRVDASRYGLGGFAAEAR